MSSYIIFALCGLKDSVNPCALTTAFGLALVVSELRKRRWNASWYSALFIAASFLTMHLTSLGALMPILYSIGFYRLARVVYFIIGIALTVCGLVHFRDWWILKRSAGKKKTLSFPLGVSTNDEPMRPLNIRTIAPVLVLSIFLSLLSTIGPTSSYVLFYSSFLPVPGKTVETYLMILIYNFMYVLPLIGIFLMISSGFLVDLIHKRLPLVKIILSALTLSVGTGLIYIFH